MKIIKYLSMGLVASFLVACGGSSDKKNDDKDSIVSSDGKGMLLSLKGSKEGRELWKTNGTTEGTTLIKDINQKKSSPKIKELTAMNNIIYFSAISSTFGTELWRSDGTKNGTYVVKDIWDGLSDSNPSNLTVVGNTLFFTASDIKHGLSLWKSDGTKNGTVRINKTFGSANSYRRAIDSLKCVGNKLYFAGDDGIHGKELWKSDGTNDGTVMVKNAHTTSLGQYSILNPTDVNGRLYYVATNEDNSKNVLWTSDGTEEGTTTINGFEGTTYWNYTVYNLTAIGSELFYEGHKPKYSYKDDSDGLWKTDGTVDGTQKIVDFKKMSKLVNVDGIAYFFAQKEEEKYKLWKSDGTAEGTVAIENSIPNDLLENEEFHLVQIKEVNEKLFYAFYRQVPGNRTYELWQSNGTTGGTHKIKDFKKIGHDIFYKPKNTLFTKLGNKLYFTASETEYYAKELWSSDGTVINTKKIKEISPRFLTVTDNNLYCGSLGGDFGVKELWKSDGTEEGTVEVKGINSGTSDANPSKLVEMNGDYYFIATNGVHGKELWKTDGTEAGTQMVKDTINQNYSNYSYGAINLDVIQNTIYFSAYSVKEKIFQLWKSDGTDAGTVKLKDINKYKYNYYIRTKFYDINGTILFQGYDSEHGIELWTTDGTPEGTKLFKDIAQDANSSLSRTREFIEINDVLYFKAEDPVNGKSLWKSDGTKEGTKMLLASPEGYDRSDWATYSGYGPNNLTDVNGTLFFTMNVDNNYTELWKSDGTKVGTKVVKRFKKVFHNRLPYGLTNINGILYFVPVHDTLYSTYGWEIWKSDGTEEGTTKVAYLGKDKYSSYQRMGKVTSFKDKIYFSLPDDIVGRELWVSDGTQEGTKLFKDFRVGKESSNPIIRGIFDDNLLFEATDNKGRKLWKTDGTVEGTKIVKDGFR